MLYLIVFVVYYTCTILKIDLDKMYYLLLLEKSLLKPTVATWFTKLFIHFYKGSVLKHLYLSSEQRGFGLRATDSEAGKYGETDLSVVGFGLFIGFADNKKHIK